MKSLFLFYSCLLVLFLLLFGGCKKDSSPTGLNNNINNNQNQNFDPRELTGEYTYHGTISMTLKYYEDGENFRTRQFEKPVVVILDRPSQVGSIIESNPFKLIISTDLTGGLSEGIVVLYSSTILVAPSGGKVFYQFWDFSYDNTTGKIKGKLTNNNIDNYYFNGVFGYDPYSIPGYPMDTYFCFKENNAAFSGNIFEHNIELNFLGWTNNNYIVVTALITADK